MATDSEVIELYITRKTATAAFGALSIVERSSNDPDIRAALNEFMEAWRSARAVQSSG